MLGRRWAGAARTAAAALQESALRDGARAGARTVAARQFTSSVQQPGAACVSHQRQQRLWDSRLSAAAAAAVLACGGLYSQGQPALSEAQDIDHAINHGHTGSHVPVETHLEAPHLPAGFVGALEAVVGEENVTVDEEQRATHGKPYNSYHKIDRAPDVVVSPSSTEQVAAVVKLCAKHKIPIIPYGGATSVEGQLLAPDGGVSMDFHLMKEVLRLNRRDHDVVVQPGVGYVELNEWLKPHGLWFPLDPGPGATVGGMSACRCSGSTAVRYGSMRENVISLTAVLPSGEIIKTGARAKKCSAGYDLCRLLVGSEGTLAVITEAVLKVHKIPTYSAAMRLAFDSIQSASALVQDTLAAGIQVGRAELMDDAMMKIINLANDKKYVEQTTVLFEFAGESQAAVAEMQEVVARLAKAHNPLAVSVSTDPETCKEMWRERKEALWSAWAQYPDLECLITDVCVPVSRLADLIGEVKAEVGASWLPSPIVAHAGDGNFHCLIFFDPAQEKDVKEVARLSKHMVDRALAMEGTCTGEHGVGYGKIKYLQSELSKPTLNMMATIKHALDPDDIMNPGKVLPHRKDPKTGKLHVCT